MDSSLDYLEQNRKLWDSRTPVHIGSSFYNMDAFLSGTSTLHAPELQLLGDISAKSVLHLQCHFGQDTISLGRMGANVCGVDFSPVAIEAAKELASRTGVDARFILSDVYSLPQHLHQEFDIVFTSYGVIGWLPDLDKWAGVIRHFLKPGGMLVFVEFHPLVWMFDNDFREITYSYFKSEAIVEEETGTYAEPGAPIRTKSVTWNHSLSEVIGALLAKGMELQRFQEYDWSPYNCLKGMQEDEKGKFRISSFGNKVPLVYSLKAIKIERPA